MGDFINDEEVEEDVEEIPSRQVRKKKKQKKPKNYAIDEDDRDIIKENFGIEVPEKKNRLKRNDQRVVASGTSYDDVS